MGIYDREYYRDETRGAGWFSGVAPACKTILALNLVVYVLQQFAPNHSLETNLSANNVEVFQHFQVWRLLTYSFLHNPQDLWHIVWNMLFLWWFGHELESMYGSREFSLFYVAAAIASGLVELVADYFLPGGMNAQVMGASGAVTAVAVVYTLFYPNREVLLFFILPMRMWVLLAIFLGKDLLQLVQELQHASGGIGPRTAVAAHLGGAAFGYLYKVGGRRFSSVFGSVRWRRPRLRIVRPERRESATLRAGSSSGPEATRLARAAGSPQVTQEQLDARLDEVLAKIAREGRSSLTDEERSILEEASRRARMKRNERP